HPFTLHYGAYQALPLSSPPVRAVILRADSLFQRKYNRDSCSGSGGGNKTQAAVNRFGSSFHAGKTVSTIAVVLSADDKAFSIVANAQLEFDNRCFKIYFDPGGFGVLGDIIDRFLEYQEKLPPNPRLDLDLIAFIRNSELYPDIL